MFWIGLIFIPLLCIWMISLFSIFTREMSGWAKALWVLAVIFLPFIGTILYLIVQPGKPSSYGWGDWGNWSLVYPYEYNQPPVPERDEVGPIHVVSKSAPVNELQMLNQLHDAGKLSDAEYASATARFATDATAAAAPSKDASAAA